MDCAKGIWLLTMLFTHEIHMKSARAVLVLAGTMVCLAQDSYVVLDRTTSRGLYLIDSAGAVTPITPVVPWQHAHSVARASNGEFIVTVNVSDGHGTVDGVYKVSPGGEVTAVAVGQPFDSPRGVAIDAAGNYVVLNYNAAENKIQLMRVSPGGQVEVLLEDKPLKQPIGIAIDAYGHYIITDRSSAGRVWGIWTNLPENGAVYRFDPVSRETTTVRSSVDANGDARLDALMGHLTGVAIDAEGNYIIVEAPPHLDSRGNWKIPIGDTYLLRMRPDGEILQTIHIPLLDDHYSIGLDVAIDRQGNYIIADAVGVTSEDGRLLRVTPAGHVTSIILTPLLGIPGGVVVLPAVVPPIPPPPHIVGLNLMPGADHPRIRFAWRSTLGQSYRIQSATKLGGGDWQDMAFLISGTGDLIEFSEQCGLGPRFYRIQIVTSTPGRIHRP